MADVGNFTAWSSTAASNSPSGSTAVSTGLDDNLREIQAQVAVWRDGTGYGILTVTSVSGSNTITGSTSPAPALAANQKFLLQPAGTNTGATTLNLNGAGAKNVYACNAALNGGEFHTSVPVLLEYDGTAFQVLGPVFKQQTRTTYSSGSGTYSLPGGCTRLVVRLVGGGGAGGPGGGAGAANGTAGGDTTFGVLTGNGGAIGTQTTGGAGGSASGGLLNIAGGSGQGPLNGGSFGGQGAGGFFGGCGGGGAASGAGTAGAPNSGSGGGGGGSSGTGNGGGGGAGGYVETVFTNPSSSYSYGVGAAGAASTGGSNGAAGGAGGSGIIIVDEFYN